MRPAIIYHLLIIENEATIKNRPAKSNSKEKKSIFVFIFGSILGINFPATIRPKIIKGIFRRNNRCQPKKLPRFKLVKKPPIRGPISMPPAKKEAVTAKAFSRSCQRWAIIAIGIVYKIAVPRPWRARTAIKAEGLLINPSVKEVKPNKDKPIK